MKTTTKLLCAVLAGLVLLWIGGGTPAEATDQPTAACFEQVDQAQYKKFTAPTETGPFDKAYPNTWWKGQVDAWHGDVGEIAEGPGNHPDGKYVYKRTAQRTVNGDEIPCPTVPTTIPETTVPETTAPETTATTTTLVDVVATTVPPVITGPAYVPTPAPPRIGDVCYQHIVPGPTLEVGNFVNYGYTNVPEATGTTRIGIAYCGPIPTPTTTTPILGQSLPSTGAEHWAMSALAATMLAFGAGALRLARR